MHCGRVLIVLLVCPSTWLLQHCCKVAFEVAQESLLVLNHLYIRQYNYSPRALSLFNVIGTCMLLGDQGCYWYAYPPSSHHELALLFSVLREWLLLAMELRACKYVNYMFRHAYLEESQNLSSHPAKVSSGQR